VFTEHPLKGGVASFLAITASTTPLTTAALSNQKTSDTLTAGTTAGLVKNAPQTAEIDRYPAGITSLQNPFATLSTPKILPLFSLSLPAQTNRDAQLGGSSAPTFGDSSSASPTTGSAQTNGHTKFNLISSVAPTPAWPKTAYHLSDSAPIPLKQLESWIQFGEVRSAWLEQRKAAKMNWFERIGAEIDRARRRDPAVEFSRKAIMRIQTTPEGREVLGQLQDEYLRTGRKLIIVGGEFRNSAVIRDNGVETINGIRGQANPIEGIYLFNRKFLEFRDKNVSMEYLCGNMAHEMRHLVSRAQIDRLSGRAGAAFSHAFIDEQRARLTGYLVAARLNKGVPTDYSDEARNLIRAPRAFWAQMKSWSIYAHNLDMDEMRDPVRAYSQRIAMLRSAIAENDANISQHFPRTESQLEVLEKREGLKGQLRDVRGIYQSLLENEPGERAANVQMLDAITDLRRKLRSPESSGLLLSYTTAHDDPAFQLLEDGLQRDMKSLASLVHHKGLPHFKPRPGQLSWAQFQERVRESQRLHPEYWVEHRARFPSGPRSVLHESRLRRLFHSPIQTR